MVAHIMYILYSSLVPRPHPQLPVVASDRTFLYEAEMGSWGWGLGYKDTHNILYVNSIEQFHSDSSLMGMKPRPRMIPLGQILDQCKHLCSSGNRH